MFYTHLEIKDFRSDSSGVTDYLCHGSAYGISYKANKKDLHQVFLFSFCSWVTVMLICTKHITLEHQITTSFSFILTSLHCCRASGKVHMTVNKQLSKRHFTQRSYRYTRSTSDGESEEDRVRKDKKLGCTELNVNV